jgi:1,4-dihydroxy-2-naphthoyl-CoA hydrolase
MLTKEYFNEIGADMLPGHLGIVITEASQAKFCAELNVKKQLMAPNGFLHAGTIVTLADTACGYACVANLPDSAIGFTTLELKSNHMSTTREGTVICTATPAHIGKTTHIWDAVVSHKESGKTIALFRCTQFILYNKQNA